MKINKVIEEAKKLPKGSPELAEGSSLSLLKKQSDPTLIHVLIEIEATIRHLSTLYASPEITSEKKSEFEKMIKDADTRAMAILTILRNRP